MENEANFQQPNQASRTQAILAVIDLKYSSSLAGERGGRGIFKKCCIKQETDAVSVVVIQR